MPTSQKEREDVLRESEKELKIRKKRKTK